MNHTDQIIPKLSVACYMVRQLYRICNNDNLISFLFRAVVYDCKYGPTTCTVLCY